ncbi:MAG: response regulator transcription factor [Cyclobacteriaceae bacterium]
MPNKRLSCLVVDDEPLARKLLKDYISKVEGLELIGSCSNAIETFSFLQQHQVDLLFLDIHMPQITGIDLLKSLRNKSKVIFTTAYREYALEAFELDVLDYLLKPITFERFLKGISKTYQLADAVVEERKATAPSPYIYFKEKNEMIKVELANIISIESVKDYVKVHTLQGEIISRQKISYLEERLPADQFIRVHRSYIVAFKHVASYNANEVSCGDLIIPLGRKYKKDSIDALMKYNVDV